MHPLLTSVHNEMRIVRVANGFAVELPRPLRHPYPSGPEPGLGDSFAEGMKKAMPWFKEMMRLRDTDPLLESLRNPEGETADPQPEPEPPVETIGIDPYTHVFSTWEEVIDFLSKIEL